MAKKEDLEPPSPMLRELLDGMRLATVLPPIPGAEDIAAELLDAFSEFLRRDGIDPEK